MRKTLIPVYSEGKLIGHISKKIAGHSRKKITLCTGCGAEIAGGTLCARCAADATKGKQYPSEAK